MWTPDTNRVHNMHDIIWLKMMFYQEKLTTVVMADATQFDDSNIDEIEVGGKGVNECEIIGTPNVTYDKNENDPQSMKNENFDKPQVATISGGKLRPLIRIM